METVTKASAPTVLVAQAGAPIVAAPVVMLADNLFAGKKSLDQGAAPALSIAWPFRLCFRVAGTNGMAAKRKRNLSGEFTMRRSTEIKRRIRGKRMGVASAGHSFFCVGCVHLASSHCPEVQQRSACLPCPRVEKLFLKVPFLFTVRLVCVR